MSHLDFARSSRHITATFTGHSCHVVLPGSDKTTADASPVQHANVLPVIQDRLAVGVALALLLVDLLLIVALVPGGLAQLAGAVPHVLAVHLPQRLCALYWVRKAHKAIACMCITSHPQSL